MRFLSRGLELLAGACLLVAVGCGDSDPPPANSAPIAADDSATVDEDSSVTIDVVANDSDPDGDAIEVVSVEAPAHGTAVLNADDTVTYRPDADWNGTDGFSYTLTDGWLGSAAAVTVTVMPVPDPPVAAADHVSTPEGVPLTFDVLQNDRDIDADALFVDSVGTPSGGTVVQNGDGSLTYVPDAGWYGDDTFTYTVSDGCLTSVGTVTVTVTADPGRPLAQADSSSTPKDLAVNIDVLSNDYEPDGEALAVGGTTAPSAGTVVVEADGTVTYTPPAGFTGTATFDYTASDPGGLTGSATVVVTVGVPVDLALAEASGLYQPGGIGVGYYVPGYVGLDNAGRIYSNRAYDPANPGDPVWTKNTQYVELAVALGPAGVVWPAEARIVWDFEDPDDPSNEDPLTHSEAGPTLDPNDYDGTDNDGDGTPDNSDGNDNTGSLDGRPVWEQVDAAWALSGGNETGISGGVSKVRFNVTDDGGDNFSVSASLRLKAGDAPVATVPTGIMTVWKRVYVEYVKMESSAGMDGLVNGQANDAFAKCFVEMVPQAGAPRAVPDVVVSSKLQMGVNDYSAGEMCDEYVTAADGEFSREGEAGWFFASAANYYVDTSSSGPAPDIYSYYADVDPDGETLWAYGGFLDYDKYQYGNKQGDLAPPEPGYQAMQTDMVFTDADAFQNGTVLYDYDPFSGTYLGSAPIISHTKGNAVTGATITYGADSPAPDGQILVYKEFVSLVTVLNPADPYSQVAAFMYRNFSWDPATWTFQVWPKGYSTPTEYNLYSFDVIDHGFPAFSQQWAYVQGTGALYVGGISPGPNGGLEGRTIVFTAAGGDLNTLVHEFGHAFGFHHICGNWDYRSHGSGEACTMHYTSWCLMLDDSDPRKPDLWVYGNEGPYYCEQHVIAIRQQNLEELAVLGWGN